MLRLVGALAVAVASATAALASEPARQEPPRRIASLKLTPPGELAVSERIPMACDRAGTIYVADQAGFRVLRYAPSGEALEPLAFPRLAPDGGMCLVDAVWVGNAVYLSSLVASAVVRVPLDGSAPSWLGPQGAGLSFLDSPRDLGPGRTEGTVAVWDPGLRLVVEIDAEGAIVGSEPGVDLTAMQAPDGGFLRVAPGSAGTWRLESSRSSVVATLPALEAEGISAVSADLVGVTSGGDWILHHYLGGETGPAAAAALRKVASGSGRIVAERVLPLRAGEDLPPPPSSAVGPDGEIYYLSGSRPAPSLMVVFP